MRYLRFFVCSIVAIAVLAFADDTEVDATPGAGGTLFFSVTMIDPAHDITPAASVPAVAGLTCTSADILTAPGAGLAMCGARPLPAPPGPVPGAMTAAPPTLGLNGGGVFTDDLDALSYGEALNTAAMDDYDFSVDPAPGDGGITTAAGVGPCIAPNVTTEAAAFQAQGDVFTTAAAAAGCNLQFTDEAALGLIAPTAPGIAPLDDIDALAELVPGTPGPCMLGSLALPVLTACAAFSLSPGSATLAAIGPNACGGPPAANGAMILVPRGTPAALPCLPAGCPVGPLAPCRAVNSGPLGLAPADDIDALCWFDGDGDGVPDLPQYMTPGIAGDYYIFSLAAGSPTLAGVPAGGADLLTPTPTGVAVVTPAAALGLLPGDEVDGLICHDLDTDLDMVPDPLDNCPMMTNPTQGNSDLDAFGDLCDTEGPPGNTNGVGGADDCTDFQDNDGDGLTDGADPACVVDTDGDGISDATDNCVTVPNAGQANGDGDTFGDACDNCPSVTNQNQANADGDTFGDACDNCPSVTNQDQANADGDAWGDLCDNCPAVATVWLVPTGDADCDGFTSASETTITTDPSDPCGFTAGMPNESDTWPPDLFESNGVNIQDVNVLKPVFGTAVPPTSARYDIFISGNVNVQDVNVLKPFFGLTCVP